MELAVVARNGATVAPIQMKQIPMPIASAPEVVSITEPRKAMGERIKRARDRKGFSQADIARHLNLSDAAVSMWEKGKTEPNLEKFIRLAEMLQTTPEYLAFGVEFRK